MRRRQFLKGSSAVAAALISRQVTAGKPLMGRQAIDPSPRETLSLDRGWRFHRGDVAAPKIITHNQTYDSTKAGAAQGAAAIKFDDEDWRQLDLPHDFVVEGPFDPNENVDQGYRPKGIGWYRRRFRLPTSDIGKHLEVQLGAIAVNATVWFNGNVVLHNWSAYSTPYIDITPFARFGDQENVIAVRVDSSPFEGWWYEGGGMYRHTWLIKRHPVHLVSDGVYAHPFRDETGAWQIPVEATIENIGTEAADVGILAALIDPNGTVVTNALMAETVPPLGRVTATVPLSADNPKLWSVDDPTLYTVRTSLLMDNRDLDGAVTTVGFRTQRFDPNLGFFLNDKPLKIKGVCIHQDHAGVGVAVPDSIIDYRLRRLKEMGCNAIRSSHHAPSVELLNAADRLGFLVMDENRLFNTSPDYTEMLEWLVRRDRNHPSVILWSVFNEEPLQGTRSGYEMVRRMAATVKTLDTRRPVTAAMNGGFFEPKNVSQAVDVVGFNYSIQDYDKFHSLHPDKPMTSSEDTSTVMTRGEYVTDKERHLLASYDEEAQPWGATHRAAWKAIAERPFVAGTFVWTGFDYRGEPQPLEWPTASSSFGAMDLCGFPKTAYYIHQAQWFDDRPILHIEPHWNWSGREGQPIRLMVISNADEVSLSLNGKQLGAQRVDRFAFNRFDVPFAPGTLEAIARKGGRVVARTAVETTGAPIALRLTADRPSLVGDGRDAVPIMVETVDSKGRHVPTANFPVTFSVSNGRIIGVGNGDANSHEPEKGDARRLYNGLAQVIVQSQRESSGLLSLTARSEGLKPARAVLVLKTGSGPRELPVI